MGFCGSLMMNEKKMITFDFFFDEQFSKRTDVKSVNGYINNIIATGTL